MPSWSLSELMSRTTEALGNRVDIPASTVSFWVNQAYDEVWNLVPHSEQETSAVTSTVASSGVVLLPSDFGSLIGMPSNLSRNNMLLQPINVTQLVSFDTATGAPVYFASYGTRLEVRPLPDSAHSLEIRYRRIQSELTLTTDVPSIATRLRSAIFHRAVQLIAQNVTLDGERAAQAQADVQAVLGAIPHAYALRNDQRDRVASDVHPPLTPSRTT